MLPSSVVVVHTCCHVANAQNLRHFRSEPRDSEQLLLHMFQASTKITQVFWPESNNINSGEVGSEKGRVHQNARKSFGDFTTSVKPPTFLRYESLRSWLVLLFPAKHFGKVIFLFGSSKFHKQCKLFVSCHHCVQSKAKAHHGIHRGRTCI